MSVRRYGSSALSRACAFGRSSRRTSARVRASSASSVAWIDHDWAKTSVSLQDGENGTKIGKVTLLTGAKAFSGTRVSFFGSEHHVLNDGTEMFPKCSWVITDTKK